jgi:uncharacterized protein YdaU (DUF1376 family)
MNFYQHHIGDFNNATRHLTRIERSIYRDLLELYYDSEKPLTTDLDRLAKRCLVEEENRSAMADVLAEFFELREDGYHNARADREIDAYQRMAQGGKRGASKRWGKPEDAPAIAPLSPPHAEANANHHHEPSPSPVTKEDTDVAQSAPVAASGDVALVFEFWKTTMKSPRSQLDPKRAKLIKAALKTGYTTEQLCDAITGCAKSPFHMGDNDRRAKFNGLDLILRNAEKIDQFIVIDKLDSAFQRQLDRHFAVGVNGRFGLNLDTHFHILHTGVVNRGAAGNRRCCR